MKKRSRSRDRSTANTREDERQFFGHISTYDPVKVGFKDGRGIDYHDKALKRADNSDCKCYELLSMHRLVKT